MEEPQNLKRKLKNANDLKSVVKIMKTISASNIHEYQQAVESLKVYSKTIEMGFQIVMMNKTEEILARKRRPETRKKLGAVIFGSDQGLCGSFNDQIGMFAIGKMKEIEHQERLALAVGERVIPVLEKAGQPIKAIFRFREIVRE